MARSPRNANYRMSAVLDASTHTITGTGTIVWRNITKNPTAELRFHLYWNAWRDDRSTFIRESRMGRGSMAGRPARDRGSIDLTSLDLDGAPALAGASFIAPDDGNADDRTVLSVPLRQPVAPGGSVTIHVGWTAHVPRPYARTGVIGRYYFIAQWFPKLGVLEDAGWNCHQFHAATEFFSDFGSYDVTLRVPQGWTVGATGTAISTVSSSGATDHRFIEDDVHDFAWTTSPDFVERTQTFSAPGLPPVDMRLLLQPEHDTDEQIARHFNAAAIALREYGTWFGPYPYGHLTIVDPVAVFNERAQGASTGGMEYPTLVTAGTRWKIVTHGLQPESVTVHEVGHQFWYGMVATNEVEHAWMDEGLNTYSTARAIARNLPLNTATVERYFGGLVPWAYEDARWTRAIDGDRLNAFRPVAAFDIPATPTWQYWPGSAGAITYNKTALWLHTLENMLGWDTMQRVLSTYFARTAFTHPLPGQFFAIANDVSGRDLTWFFDQVYRSTATFDYAVAQVTNTPSAAGVESLALVRRLGTGVFPVDVRVSFKDGTAAVEHWDGASPWRAFTYRGASPIAAVVVDPDQVLALDLNRTNNSWAAAPDTGLAVHRWVLKWVTWAEEALLSYAFFS